MRHKPVSVGILAVGTELTEGTIQDAHVRYLSNLLRCRGFRVVKAVIIPDNSDQFHNSLSDLNSASDIVIVTGGLGPTSDDLTREIIAREARVELEYKSYIWEDIKNRFPIVGTARSNMRQAYIPAGFEVIPNPSGTAPGFTGLLDPSFVIALPGPPRELKPMFENRVLPMLEKMFIPEDSDELRGSSCLLPESQLEDLLQRLKTGDVEWGTRIDDGRIAFILKNGTDRDRRTMFENLRKEAGTGIIREMDIGIEEQFTSLLISRKLTFVTAESCTGGLVGDMVSRIPGCSEMFWGGFVTYNNEAKISLLNVKPSTLERYGAVSEQTVIEMVNGALSASGADIGVAVSGIAGPSGGTAEKPVGTVWIAAGNASGRLLSRKFLFGGLRNMVRSRAAVGAFLLAESVVLEKESLDSVINSEYI